VLEFMRRHGLGLDDLTDIGGEHLKSPAPTQREMAARVSRCWELIARNGVNFAELVTAVGSFCPLRHHEGDATERLSSKSLRVRGN
jgi:hypothetical protein